MRVIEIAQKLHHKHNEYPRKRLAEWIEKSKDYAVMMIERYGFNNAQKTEEGYRLLFLMNHICPNLYHFHKKPNWTPMCKEDWEEYNEEMSLHMMENSQAGFADADGNVIQDGIHYTNEEYYAFLQAIADLI